MGTWVLVFIVVLILSLVKSPSGSKHDSGEMTDARRRKLIKKGEKAIRDRTRPQRGLPWMDPNYQKRKKRNSSKFDF